MSAKRLLGNLRRGRAQRTLAAATAASALPLGLEIYFEHFRGSFGDKWMWTPVALSPLLTAAGLAGVGSKRAARTVLPAASRPVLPGRADRRLHPRTGRAKAPRRVLRAALQHRHGAAAARAWLARSRRRHGPCGGARRAGALRAMAQGPSSSAGHLPKQGGDTARGPAHPARRAPTPAQGHDAADARALPRLRRARAPPPIGTRRHAESCSTG